MRISVIIPTYNHLSDCLIPCLESIKKYTDYPDFEVLVVANGCKDGTKAYVESLGPPFKLIWIEEAAGYTESTNEGIKAATGDFVILLNNDTVLLPQKKNQWLEILTAPFFQDEKIGITGPMKTYCPKAKRDFLIFFCVCTRKKFFDEIGLLDEAFSPGYGEDTDWCCKLENSGYKIHSICNNTSYSGPNRMLGDFPIYHEGNVTFKNWVGGERLLEKNNQILFERYGQYEPDIEKARKCDGFINDQELRWLGKEAKKRKTIVEIGSWHGKSSRAIGDNLMADGILYCIDTWNGSITEQDTNHASAKWKDGDHAFYEFLQNNLDLVQAGKIIPLRMTSLNAAALLKEMQLKADMIFIDAGHTYEEVCKDIDAWKGLIDDNGIFCGHDFNAWDGVNRAISEKLTSFYVGIGTTIWYCDKNSIKLPKADIYDCFPFNNEFDVLETRLAELYDVVDRFVITEATKTHSGKPKPLYFKDNLKRFEKYLNKISHVIVDDYPALDNWSIERHQRDCAMRALTQCKDNDIVIISDLDEIPNPKVIELYKSMPIVPADSGIRSLEQKLFYYNLHCQAVAPWIEAKILPYGALKKLTPCGARYHQCLSLSNGGWHFSYLGSIDDIVKKIEDTPHQEYNTPNFNNKEWIENAIKNNIDLFGRNLEYTYVDLGEGYPKFIRENKEYFKNKGLL